MDLGLGEQQEMLSRSAREFLEAECPTTVVRELEDSERGYSPELWERMAGLGWLGLAFPGRFGGSEGSLLDQVVLFEEVGRALLPSPMLTSSVLAGQIFLNAADEEQKSRLLTSIGAGDTIVSVALAIGPHGGGDSGVSVTPDGSGYVVSGTSLFVPYAHVSDYVLCVSGTPHNGSHSSGADGEVGLYLVDTKDPGYSTTLMDSVASYKQHEVRLQDVRVPSENVVGNAGRAGEALAEAMDWATVVQCGEIVGRAQKVLDMVVDYSKFRVQFGRPIGSFQAVQHRCADLRVAVDGARLATYRAAWKIMEGLPSSEDVAIAKAFAGNLSRRAAVEGHSIFAGIAFTVEHDMQLYTARSKIAEANLGDTDYHLDRLGSMMGF